MAYFIFLKYLRSLEEFRKNPHIKIPPKSPCANFQSLGIFKNVIFIQKGIFFRIWPIRPSPSRAGPLRPYATLSPLGPLGPSHVGINCRKPYSLRLCALWQRRLLSLKSLPCGARLSTSSPSPRRPTIAASSRRLWPPRAAQPPTSGCQARSSLHALIPLLISPLNPSSSRPAINGIKTITAGRFLLPRPGVPLPGHYKRARSTPRPSPHSPRPQLLVSESAMSTPPSASSADCSPPSPSHV
jgi:hypothetical protein